jgi:hypothetical protein
MINLEKLPYNTVLSLLFDDSVRIECKIKEYAWSPHRHPLYAILEIIKTEDHEKWPISSEMYFPLEAEEDVDNMSFIHKVHCNFNNNIEVIKKVKIHMEVKKQETISPQLPDGVKNYMVDIDGTITDDVPNEEPDRMSTVEPYEGSVEMINEWYAQGHIITFFTSRTEEHREITETWLNKYGFKYHGMLMEKPRGGNYHWIDNHIVRATRYNGKWTPLEIQQKNVEVFGN